MNKSSLYFYESGAMQVEDAWISIRRADTAHQITTVPKASP